MTEELKRCPFCNGYAHEFISGVWQSTPKPAGWHGRTIKHYIMCQDCHCKTDEEDDIQMAYDAWNKRHD